MSDKNSVDKGRTVISLGMAAVLIIGFVAASIATTLAAQVPINPNTQEQQEEGRSVDQGLLVAGNSESHTSNDAVRQITLIAQDAEVEIAPGKVVKMWTFNGTVPAPPLRFTEGENVSIEFINETPIPHTIHFHGNHDDKNDGVLPQIMPNESYTYNITAAPAGALMYHCHAYPASLHIRMGMYGAMIIDPKSEPLEAAREFVMVMSEYDSSDIMKFEAEYYPINGYADQYMSNPLKVNHGELVRMYVINIGTTIPYQFHLHSTIFKAYPSGLLSNEPIDAQTYPVGPGDAAIIEARWQYPGTYLFHSHGIQEERGNMGQIEVTENGSEELTESVSMFDWQYELQKQMQKPEIIDYEEQTLQDAAATAQPSGHGITHESNSSTSNNSSHVTEHDTEPATNAAENETNAASQDGDDAATTTDGSIVTLSIPKGAIDPNSEKFYEPSTVVVKPGSIVRWINEDSAPHTATSGSPESGPSGDFDTGIIGPGQQSADQVMPLSNGVFEYYCTLHPYMKDTIGIEE